jgi:polar amino acid transport system substrate-binding protein
LKWPNKLNKQNQETCAGRFCYLWQFGKMRLILVLLAIALATLPNIHQTDAASLVEIQKRGKLIVAVKDNSPPLAFLDENGRLQGLEIDIAKRLAQELLGDENAIIFLPVKNQDRLKVVLEGKVDLAIASITQTKSRLRVVNFSPYYYLNGTALITKNSHLTRVNRLSKVKIAVLNNSDTISNIQNSLPNAQLMGVNSYQEAYHLLENNLAEFFAGDRTILTGWVQQHTEYRLLAQNFSAAPLAVVMPKGLQYLELHTQVNGAIAQWRTDWLPERLEYWGLDN